MQAIAHLLNVRFLAAVGLMNGRGYWCSGAWVLHSVPRKAGCRSFLAVGSLANAGMNSPRFQGFLILPLAGAHRLFFGRAPHQPPPVPQPEGLGYPSQNRSAVFPLQTDLLSDDHFFSGDNRAYESAWFWACLSPGHCCALACNSGVRPLRRGPRAKTIYPSAFSLENF